MIMQTGSKNNFEFCCCLNIGCFVFKLPVLQLPKHQCLRKIKAANSKHMKTLAPSMFNFFNKNACENNPFILYVQFQQECLCLQSCIAIFLTMTGTAVWCQVLQGVCSYPQVAQASDSRWSDKGAV